MSTEDICLTEDELELYLDLASYLNPAPYIVPEDMSLAKVHEVTDLSFLEIDLACCAYFTNRSVYSTYARCTIFSDSWA